MNHTDTSEAILEAPLLMDTLNRKPPIAFVRDARPAGQFVMITPNAMHTLVEHDIQVFMQHGFAAGSPYSDMDYANAGVAFEDDFYLLAKSVKTLVKFQPFEAEQFMAIQKGQILISTQDVMALAFENLRWMQGKEASAVALNLLTNERGESLLEQILGRNVAPEVASEELSRWLLPKLMNLALSGRLQLSRELLSAAYLLNGKICHRALAERFGCSYHDIISPCMGLN